MTWRCACLLERQVADEDDNLQGDHAEECVRAETRRVSNAGHGGAFHLRRLDGRCADEAIEDSDLPAFAGVCWFPI